MANFETRMRTNGFNVTDVDAFITEINKLHFPEPVMVDILDYDNGRIALYGGDLTHATSTMLVGNDNRMDVDVYVPGLIQEYMQDGEVVIATCVGYEKHRDVLGFSTLITKQKVLTVNAESAVKELAIRDRLIDVATADALRSNNN